MNTTSDLNSSLRAVHELISSRLAGRRLRIYEAGGGSISYLPENLIETSHISVVDVDETQLKKNTYATQKILGDIQTYSFPPNSFDLVVCYNVIEHLDAPDQAIRMFHRALIPGGLLFIGAPNPKSFSGLVTRFTPHTMHIWYYYLILGKKSAGQRGEPPFRTIYHKIVNPSNLVNFCRTLGSKPIYLKEYQSRREREMLRSRPFIGWLLYAITGILNVFALGRRNFRNGDYHVVFEKRGETE